MARASRRKPTRDTWGSVTRLGDGRWRVRYPGPDGRRRSGGVFRTKAEADEARARLHASLASGTWRPTATGTSPALAAFAMEWLDAAARAEDLSPRTVALYRRQLERLVLPEIGDIALGMVPVARLSRSLVTTWEAAARVRAREGAAAYAARRNGTAAQRRRGHDARRWAREHGVPVADTGRLPASVLAAWKASKPAPAAPDFAAPASGDRQFEQARTVLSAVCTAAIDAGYLKEHPVRQLPGTSRRRRNERTAQGVRHHSAANLVSVDDVFTLAAAMPEPYGVAALLTTFAGLRGGETFALAKRHLTYDECGRVSHVLIERALLELPGRAISFGPPKSGAGVRRVALPSQIGEKLAAYVAQLGEADANSLLFSTVGGRPVSRARRSDVMARARERSGIAGVTWHTLRHLGLTLAAGVPGTTVRNLMDRGGHSTPRAALIYQHSALDADTTLAAGLSRIIAEHEGNSALP